MDDVIWSCPDCDGDLERDGYGLWCPACEQVVPYACLPADPDDDPPELHFSPAAQALIDRIHDDDDIY